jgi:hypothetical protein
MFTGDVPFDGSHKLLNFSLALVLAVQLGQLGKFKPTAMKP